VDSCQAAALYSKQVIANQYHILSAVPVHILETKVAPGPRPKNKLSASAVHTPSFAQKTGRPPANQPSSELPAPSGRRI